MATHSIVKKGHNPSEEKEQCGECGTVLTQTPACECLKQEGWLGKGRGEERRGEEMEGPGNICGFAELRAKPYSGYQPAQDAVFLPSLFFQNKQTNGKTECIN